MKLGHILLALATAQLVAYTWLPGTEAAKAKCPASREREMDVCASRMGFLGDHSFTVPKNLTVMSGFCATLKESIGCIQNYSRDCLGGFTKQLLTSLLKRGKQQYSLICHDEASKRDFMSKMSCLADDKIDQFHTCMDASVVRFEHIRGIARADQRLPSLCCSYHIFNRDVDEVLNRICAAPASSRSETSQFVHKIVGGTAGEFFALICDSHRSLDECRASDKTRDSLRRLEELTKSAHSGKVKPKSKSLVPALLDILASSEAPN